MKKTIRKEREREIDVLALQLKSRFGNAIVETITNNKREKKMERIKTDGI